LFFFTFHRIAVISNRFNPLDLIRDCQFSYPKNKKATPFFNIFVNISIILQVFFDFDFKLD